MIISSALVCNLLTFSLTFPLFQHVLLEIAVWGFRVCVVHLQLESGCCHRARARVCCDVQAGAGWDPLCHISVWADVCTSVVFGGDDGGELVLKAQIKEECHLMSDLKPVIPALADSHFCFFFAYALWSHTIFSGYIHIHKLMLIYKHTLIVIPFNLGQANI